MGAQREIQAVFDPFNHGTTTIRYLSVSQEAVRALEPVLQLGWGLNAPWNVRQMDLGPLGQDRYFSFEDRGRQYFFKKNRPSLGRQLLIDKAQEYCRIEGVPTRELVRTQAGETSHLDLVSGQSYSLAKFIDGEHFDGSRAELLEVAGSVARMHSVFSKIPFSEEVKASKDFSLKHDPDVLNNYLERSRVESFGQTGELPMTVDEIASASSRVVADLQIDLPVQTIHMDLHPHNVLFSPDSHDLVAIVDFEQVRLSQRIRDVGFAMHRFSRVYGPMTEKRQDIGTDIRVRASQFLDQYNTQNSLSPQELKSLVLVLQDEALTRIGIVLGGFYESGSPQFVAELGKQVATLKECKLFEAIV